MEKQSLADFFEPLLDLDSIENPKLLFSQLRIDLPYIELFKRQYEHELVRIAQTRESGELENIYFFDGGFGHTRYGLVSSIFEESMN